MEPKFKLLQPDDFKQEVIGQIIDLGKRSGIWQKSDIEYYKKQFPNPRNIQIIYTNGEGLIAGYILAKPHNEAVLDYLVEDPLMKMSDSQMVYVDVVMSDVKKGHALVGMHLINELIRESNRRGISRFSLHCRVINGFSKIIQRKFKKGVDIIRRIEKYIDCNDEPADYMEVVVDLET